MINFWRSIPEQVNLDELQDLPIPVWFQKAINNTVEDRDCCEIDLWRLLTLNLDRLTRKMWDFGTKNHQKLEISGFCDSVCVFRNSLRYDN